MEIEVGTFEAKNRLSELLAAVEKGQRIFITRRGKRVALLVSALSDDQEYGDEELLERFRDFRRAAKPGEDSLKSLVDEGRW